MEHHVSESNATMVHLDQKDCNLNSLLWYHPKMDEFQGLIINHMPLVPCSASLMQNSCALHALKTSLTFSLMERNYFAFNQLSNILLLN